MDKLRVGILGATGVVGQVFLKILKDHPWFEVESLYASEKSSGKKVSSGNERGKELVVKEATVDSILRDKLDIIFSAVSDDKAGFIELSLAKKGGKVFSNASANRLDPEVPLVVPEINMDHLEILDQKAGYIVTNGNCSTIGTALGMAPLLQFKPRDIVVTSLQSVSGAGYPGVSSMDILGNVIPFIGGEEYKIVNESKKIFGIPQDGKIVSSNMDLTATATRVPVMVGHMISVSIVPGNAVSEEEFKKAYFQYGNGKITGKFPSLPRRSICLMDEEDRPQPILEMNSPDYRNDMEVFVGRLRSSGHRLSAIFLINNLVRGAAGASILNAEIMAKMEGMI